MSQRKRPERQIYTPPPRRSAESRDTPVQSLDQKSQDENPSPTKIAKFELPSRQDTVRNGPNQSNTERIIHAWEVPDAQPETHNISARLIKTNSKTSSSHTRQNNGRGRGHSGSNAKSRKYSSDRHSPSRHPRGESDRPPSANSTGSHPIKFSLSYISDKGQKGSSHERSKSDNHQVHESRRDDNRQTRSQSARKTYSEVSSQPPSKTLPPKAEASSFEQLSAEFLDGLQGTDWADFD